jgi:hypothetical protein
MRAKRESIKRRERERIRRDSFIILSIVGRIDVREEHTFLS